MANSETYTRRMERELRVFLALFRKNRILAISILVGGATFIAYQAGLFSIKTKKPSEDIALQVLEQAKAYQELFKEYKKVSDQLIDRRTAETKSKIQKLKKELDIAKQSIKKSTAKLPVVRLPPENGGVEVAPESVVQAWQACVEGADGSESGCNALLSSGLFPVYRLARSPACGVEKYIDGKPIYNECRHPSHGIRK